MSRIDIDRFMKRISLNSEDDVKKIFIIAGEASGDLIGSEIMKNLKLIDKYIDIYGVGGDTMIEQGLDSLFSIKETSVMGLFEVFSNLKKIKQLLNRTIKEIEKIKPNVLVTIDSPGFTFPVAKHFRNLINKNPDYKDMKLIHIVAPSVWVWRSGRAKKYAYVYDHLLTLLPFEPPYFTKYDLKTTFIGHPILDYTFNKVRKNNIKELYPINDNGKNLCMLPGSRKNEIEKLMPVFEEVSYILKNENVEWNPILIIAPTVREEVLDLVKLWRYRPITVISSEDKHDLLNVCDVALAASGTVSLELAMAKIPAVITYKVSYLTHLFLSRFIKTKYYSIINILNDGIIMPEVMLKDCNPKNLAIAVNEVIKIDKSTYIKKINKNLVKLKNPIAPPAELAAMIINEYVSNNKDFIILDDKQREKELSRLKKLRYNN